MTTGHVFMAISLDGFVARKDDQIDWLTKQKTDPEEYGYAEFEASVDGIVMGSGSFKNVLTFGGWHYKKPVVVMSKTMSQADVPVELAGKVRVSALEPSELMQSLDEDGWSRAYVDGGKIVQSFINHGLIDDLNLTIVPVLIGDGKRLFGPIDADIDLELIGTKSFESGLIQSRYRVARGAEANP
jgi:dihydrofolate reductase